MTDYIIHACPNRMWYVEEYLVPSMKEQGIENIIVKCDNDHLGNLESCMRIFQSLPDDGGSWHLQDDVIICRNFKKRTEELASGIVCGFAWSNDGNIGYVGTVTPYTMRWSFPCIYIPNKIAKECASWFYRTAKYNLNYIPMLKDKKYDDWFFREYLRIFYPAYPVVNLEESLVDHIDYLIGGTVTNIERKNKNVYAKWFKDPDLVNELRMKLRGENSMKYIIMCGGKYSAWNIPRQLTEINEEPIIARTIRLLKENGVTDIYISSHDERFAQFAPLLKHKNDFQGYVEHGGSWVDAFYPTEEPVCYIMGDVVFSPEAIKTIVNTQTDSIDFFASSPPFDSHYIKEDAEPFAFKVVDQDRFRNAIDFVKRNEESGIFRRRPIAWELWQVINGEDVKKINYHNYVVINDYTCDIDSKEDIAKIERVVE